MTDLFKWDTGGGEGGTPPMGRHIYAGDGLWGGGDLSADITIHAGAGDGIAVDADSIRVKLATISGLSLALGDLQIDDTIAGGGLTIANKVLSISTGNGIEVIADTVAVSLATTSGLEFSTGKLQLADTIAGDGLTIASKVLAVNLASAGGLQLAADALSIKLETNSGLGLTASGLSVADTIAGAGLTITNKILAVGAGALMAVDGDAVGLSNGTAQYQVPLTGATPFAPAWSTASWNPSGIAVLMSDANSALTLASVYADTIDSKTALGNLQIKSKGDIIFNPTGSDILPNINYTTNLGSINKKYMTIWGAELWVETLVAQDVVATIGGHVIVAPSTMLTADVGTTDTTIYIKHNNVAVNDVIYLASEGKVEWMRVTSLGDYSCDVTRGLDSGGVGDLWYAGDAIVNTGYTNDGYIDIYSVNSIRSASHIGPTIVGNVRAGAQYADIVEAWAVGNLNGVYGYSSGDIYGAAFGKYADSQSVITIDTANGIRLRHINGSGFEYNRIHLTIDGNLTINNSAGNAVFSFDSSSGAEFTLPLTLGANGGIYQGTGSFATPTTGLKIWNDTGIGRIAGYNTGTLQWYASTDGKLYAGGGEVILGANGILINSGTGAPNTISWARTGYGNVGTINAYYTAPSTENTIVINGEASSDNLANGVVIIIAEQNSGLPGCHLVLHGDTQIMNVYNNVQITSDGTFKLLFGLSGDVNLYRSAADTLATDDTFAAIKIAATTNGSTGGVFIGTDTQLYRSAIDVLYTPDTFQSNLHVTAPKLTASTDGSSGGVFIGSDTQLYRGTTGTIYTPDHLRIGGGLTVGDINGANVTGVVTLPKITAPGTPALGYGYNYTTSDGFLYHKNDAGVISQTISYTALTDYSSSSTVIGWSSFTTKVIKYVRVGGLIYVHFYISGTSNSTTTTFTVPVNNASGAGTNLVARVQDNTAATVAGIGSLPSASNVVDMRRDMAGSTWTASGTKSIYGHFWYWAG